MEILLGVLAGWLAVSVAAAVLIGRLLSAADRRERATVITGIGMPRSTRETVSAADDVEVHETA
jgi:hypothetical protein